MNVDDPVRQFQTSHSAELAHLASRSTSGGLSEETLCEEVPRSVRLRASQTTASEATQSVVFFARGDFDLRKPGVHHILIRYTLLVYKCVATFTPRKTLFKHTLLEVGPWTLRDKVPVHVQALFGWRLVVLQLIEHINLVFQFLFECFQATLG